MKICTAIGIALLFAATAAVLGLLAVTVGWYERRCRVKRRIQECTDDVPESLIETQEIEIMRAQKLEIYKDAGGEWRWRILSANGNLVACCGEGYKTQSKCAKGYRSMADRIKLGLTEAVQMSR